MKSERARELIEKYTVGNSCDAAPSLLKRTAIRCIELAEQEAEERVREELTRWHDPQKPPMHEQRVIVKVALPNRSVFVTGGWYAINDHPQGWSVDLDRTFRDSTVIGWREVQH